MTSSPFSSLSGGFSAAGSAWQTAQEATISGQPTTHTTFDLTVTQSATMLQMQITCGATPSTVTFGYDATPTSFSLYLTSGRVDVYDKL